MQRKRVLHAEAARIRRVNYALTMALAIMVAIFFSIYHFTWMKGQYDATISRIEHTVMGSTKGYIKDAVDRTIAEIDLERRLTREAMNVKPGDAEGEREADRLAREHMKVRIRETRLRDNGYLWVNEVIDMRGGAGYARRLVHPFLLDTEGVLLSTDGPDSEGNYPYRAELEGVVANGSVFNTYFFKKPGEQLPSLKLSYSRLYADFSWIVGTGVYLDDLDKILAYERSQASISLSTQAKTSMFGLIFAIAGVLFLVLVVDRVTSKALNDSYSRILSTEEALRAEKAKVDAAYALMKELAERDELTGLRNRRSGSERLKVEMARAKRAGSPFCAAMVDIDHFKLFNDRYGHDTGDLVLKATAAAIEEGIRVEDLAMRWGGEEFLLLLSGNGLAEALEATERIRMAVSERKVIARGTELSVTITLGVAEYDRGESVEELIARADSAMYEGKAAGRNTVFAAAPPSTRS